MTNITIIGKPGCHLCDDARAVIERVADERGLTWDEQNILDDDALAAKYAELIPVILIDGKQHDYWHVDENRLNSALDKAAKRG